MNSSKNSKTPFGAVLLKRRSAARASKKIEA
jgi:hypothetical protein